MPGCFGTLYRYIHRHKAQSVKTCRTIDASFLPSKSWNHIGRDHERHLRFSGCTVPTEPMCLHASGIGQRSAVKPPSSGLLDASVSISRGERPYHSEITLKKILPQNNAIQQLLVANWGCNGQVSQSKVNASVLALGIPLMPTPTHPRMHVH